MEKIYWDHPSSEVSGEAKIGRGTKIWQNSQVLAGAKIGDNCTIGHNCFIGSEAVLGNGVKVESNTDVWNLVTLKDFVFVGPSAVFTNDPTPRAKFPKSKFPKYGKWLETIVEEGATIGANATIVCGNKIGKWAMVAAGSVVTHNVPDYALVIGVPAKFAGWRCECGNKIVFNGSKGKCSVCPLSYKKDKKNIFKIKIQ